MTDPNRFLPPSDQRPQLPPIAELVQHRLIQFQRIMFSLAGILLLIALIRLLWFVLWLVVKTTGRMMDLLDGVLK